MFILFSLILFFLNILSVNKIREIKFYKESSSQSNKIFNERFKLLDNNFYLVGNFTLSELKELNIFDLRNENRLNLFTKNIYDILYLTANRWVGIDALMAVSAQKKIFKF